ncbi:MAG: hypothetical protein NTY83_03165 [Candidatus Micrarchaeota archaeon]|nr:hypothetical protein [Candidatus Micrarchaeota archaeon]
MGMLGICKTEEAGIGGKEYFGGYRPALPAHFGKIAFLHIEQVRPLACIVEAERTPSITTT